MGGAAGGPPWERKKCFFFFFFSLVFQPVPPTTPRRHLPVALVAEVCGYTRRLARRCTPEEHLSC